MNEIDRASEEIREPHCLGMFDVPQPGAVSAGLVVVEGWCAIVDSDGSIYRAQRLIARLGANEAVLSLGVYRPDVADALGNAPTDLGYIGVIQDTALSSGARELSVVAFDHRGEPHQSGPVLKVEVERIEAEEIDEKVKSSSRRGAARVLESWLNQAPADEQIPALTAAAVQLAEANSVAPASSGLAVATRLVRARRLHGADLVPDWLLAAVWKLPGAESRLQAGWEQTGWGKQFVVWLNQDADEESRDRAPGTHEPLYSRFAEIVYAFDGSARARFADPKGADRVPYLRWLISKYRQEVPYLIDPLRVTLRFHGFAHEPRRRRLSIRRTGRHAASVGVNVVGHFRDTSGLAEATRSTARALRSIAMPYVEVDVGPTHPRVAPTAGGTSPPHAFVTSIFHDNVAHALTTGRAFGKRYFAERHTIGYLYWEVEGLPEAYTPALDQFDEIWAPTEFVAKNIANHTERPVHVVQPNVEVADAKPPCRSSFGLPGGRFLFLALASVHSVVERKNPLGAVDAFSRAFTGAELAEVGLVLKVSNLSLRPDLRSAIEEATRRLPIFVLEETLTRADTLGLMASVDVLVSLHRGEGFGLPVAEAMALGVPTIASAFSGNVDFTTADTSIPVPCKVVTLERDYGPYLAGCRWAEPDIDAAAQAMRRLRDDSTLRESIVANGRRFILDRFSPAATAEALRSRLPR